MWGAVDVGVYIRVRGKRFARPSTARFFSRFPCAPFLPSAPLLRGGEEDLKSRNIILGFSILSPVLAMPMNPCVFGLNGHLLKGFWNRF